MPNPTHRQQQIFDFMVAHLRKHRIPATIRAIGAAMGISSPNGVLCTLRALERKGLVVRHSKGDGGKNTYLPAIVENECPLCGGRRG